MKLLFYHPSHKDAKSRGATAMQLSSDPTEGKVFLTLARQKADGGGDEGPSFDWNRESVCCVRMADFSDPQRPVSTNLGALLACLRGTLNYAELRGQPARGRANGSSYGDDLREKNIVLSLTNEKGERLCSRDRNGKEIGHAVGVGGHVYQQGNKSDVFDHSLLLNPAEVQQAVAFCESAFRFLYSFQDQKLAKLLAERRQAEAQKTS